MFRFAMPIALVGSNDTQPDPYSRYYLDPARCKFELKGVFNTEGSGAGYLYGKCSGLYIAKNLAVPDSGDPTDFDILALTDGYLSVTNSGLILRLPRHNLFKTKSGSKVLDKTINYGSGELFKVLQPQGPQLRHIVYSFAGDIAVFKRELRKYIRDIIGNREHPCGGLMMYNETKKKEPGPITLEKCIADGDPGVVESIVNDILDGGTELFVAAGDVIANLHSFLASVVISFHDSCGHEDTMGATTVLKAPGRPINPSYYLYLLQSETNHKKLKSFTRPDTELDTKHPINFLLKDVVGNAKLDLASDFPPPPLTITLEVKKADGTKIAGEGLPIHHLGDFHTSMNASKKNDKESVVKWRIIGTLPTDNVEADKGKIVLQLNTTDMRLIPEELKFKDGLYTPQPEDDHRQKVKLFWKRYGAMINEVAKAYQIPCEIMLAIICIESALMDDKTDIGKSREMDMIRLEPLKINAPEDNDLKLYKAFAGSEGNEEKGILGTKAKASNADIPLTWDAHLKVDGIDTKHNYIFTSDLTWERLAIIGSKYKKYAIISPGISQVTIANLDPLKKWVEKIYGYGSYLKIGVVISEKSLAVSQFPEISATPTVTNKEPQLDEALLLPKWFGLSSDNDQLTKSQRALNQIFTCGAYIRQRYNFMITDTLNLVSDWDIITHLGTYNDGGNPSGDKEKEMRKAIPTDKKSKEKINASKWQCLFNLMVFGAYYPKDCPLYYNATIALFNTEAGSNDLPFPSVRLWHT